MKRKRTKTVKKSTARRAVGVNTAPNANSKLGRVIAEYKAAGAQGSDNAATAPTVQAPIQNAILCFRKAYPSEILSQLEPILRQAGVMPLEILEVFAPLLVNKGYTIHEIDMSEDETYGSDDWRIFTITESTDRKRHSPPGPAPA